MAIVGVSSWDDYLKRKAAEAEAAAKQIDASDVEDKAVKKAAAKGRKAPDAGN